MGQHRKTKHHRRIIVTAAAIGAVGVPSVALACSEWPSGTPGQPQAAVQSAPVAGWQHGTGHHPSNGAETAVPTTVVPTTAVPTTTAPGSAVPGNAVPGTAAPEATAPQTAAPAAPPVTAHPGGNKARHVKKHVKKKVTAPRPAQSTEAGAPRATAAPAAPAPAPSTSSAAPTAAGTPKPAAAPSGVTAEILRLVNAQRGQAGCQPLTLNSTLTKAAQAHSADMAAHKNMSHTGSDGSSPGDRITRAGYTWSTYGENVAYGYSTAQQVMDGWMSSPGHRANILNCGFKEIGVGLAQPGSYWTQDFGTAR
ncbi:CAP domain-containing protein [Streptomyces sp. SID486]|uniref:CAP domain-containing protein n=1 Tax=Streptomyces sp. SID486 TaxID=2690264 RepID=UPI00136B1503|nr:CAP domain-containing protein [Streptomyces sp. SID486]MYX95093.1 CAP domain-containing protein [Streptomyces sp. SID486]